MKISRLILCVAVLGSFCVSSFAGDKRAEEKVNSLPGKPHITWGYKEKSKDMDEILTDSLRQLYNAKSSSAADQDKGRETFIAMSCVSFASYEKADLNNPKATIWKVQVQWMDNSMVKSKDYTLKASTRELAASYSMCRVWGEEKIKFGQIKGTFVERAEVINDQ